MTKTPQIILASAALMLLALFGQYREAHSQTPHLNCTHAASNSSAYIRSNECDDTIDNALNDQDTLDLFSSDANTTMSAAQMRGGMLLNITSSFGSLTATRDVDLANSIERTLLIRNGTTGNQSITISQNAGTTVEIGNGDIVLLHADGTNVRGVLFDLPSITTQNTIDDANDLGVYWDASANALRKTTLDNWPGSGGGGSVSLDSSDWLLIETQTLSGANVDLFYDDTLYEEIEITINNLDMSADDTAMLRFSTDGSTFASGASDYEWSYQVVSDVGTNSASGDAADSEIELVSGTGGAAANENNSYKIYLTTPDDATHKRVYYIGTITDTGGTTYSATGHGAYTASTSGVNGVQVGTVSTATFDSGTVTIRGRLKTPTQAAATIQTTDATVTDLWTLSLASGETATVVATVNAQLSTNAEIYSARILNTCANISGTTSCGTQNRQEIEIGSPDAGLDASLVADDTADTIDLDVTGAASETWDWQANLRIIKQ